MFKTIDFDQINEYERLRGKNWIGFAEVHLNRCKKESKSDDEINIEVYTQLVELDSRLGTTATEQIFTCILHSHRMDFLEVRIEQNATKITIKINLVDKNGKR